MRLHKILFSIPVCVLYTGKKSDITEYWSVSTWSTLTVGLTFPSAFHIVLMLPGRLCKPSVQEKKKQQQQGLSLSCLILHNSPISAMFTSKQYFFFFKNQTTAAAHFLTGISWTYLSRKDDFFSLWILKLTRRDHPIPWEANQKWESVLVSGRMDKGFIYIKIVICAHISCQMDRDTHCFSDPFWRPFPSALTLEQILITKPVT